MGEQVGRESESKHGLKTREGDKEENQDGK